MTPHVRTSFYTPLALGLAEGILRLTRLAIRLRLLRSRRIFTALALSNALARMAMPRLVMSRLARPHPPALLPARAKGGCHHLGPLDDTGRPA